MPMPGLGGGYSGPSYGGIMGNTGGKAAGAAGGAVNPYVNSGGMPLTPQGQQNAMQMPYNQGGNATPSPYSQPSSGSPMSSGSFQPRIGGNQWGSGGGMFGQGQQPRLGPSGIDIADGRPGLGGGLMGGAQTGMRAMGQPSQSPGFSQMPGQQVNMFSGSSGGPFNGRGGPDSPGFAPVGNETTGLSPSSQFLQNQAASSNTPPGLGGPGPMPTSFGPQPGTEAYQQAVSATRPSWLNNQLNSPEGSFSMGGNFGGAQGGPGMSSAAMDMQQQMMQQKPFGRS